MRKLVAVFVLLSSCVISASAYTFLDSTAGPTAFANKVCPDITPVVRTLARTTLANDGSNTSISLTLNTGAISYVAGKYWSISVTGGNSNINLPTLNSAATVAFWHGSATFAGDVIMVIGGGTSYLNIIVSNAGYYGFFASTAFATLTAYTFTTITSLNTQAGAGVSGIISPLVASASYNHIALTINAQGYTIYFNGALLGTVNNVLTYNSNPMLVSFYSPTGIYIYAGAQNAGAWSDGILDLQVYNVDMSTYGYNLYNGGALNTSIFCLPPSLQTATVRNTATSATSQWTSGPTNTVCSDSTPTLRYVGGGAANTFPASVSTTGYGSTTTAATTTGCTLDSTNGGFSLGSTSASFLAASVTPSTAISIAFWLRHTSTTLQPMFTLGNGLRMWAGAYGACVSNYTGATTTATTCSAISGTSYTLTTAPMRYLTANTWNHFLFVANSNNGFTMFINGVLSAAGNGTWSTYYGSAVTVGAATPGWVSGTLAVLGDLQVRKVIGVTRYIS